MRVSLGAGSVPTPPGVGKDPCLELVTITRRSNPCSPEIGINHDLHQPGERDPGFPAKNRCRPGRIGNQHLHLGRPEVAGVYPDMVFHGEPGIGEGRIQELLHGMGLPGADDVVPRLFLLEDPPHALHVLGCKPPVPPRFEVAQVQVLFFPSQDPGDAPGDLAGHEGLSPPGGLVVEEDAVCRVQGVAFAVVPGHPVGIELRTGVRAPGEKRRLFVLGRWCRSKHLGGRGLVEADPGVAAPDSLEQAGCPQAGHVPGILRGVKAHPDVALGTQVVDLVRTDIIDDVGDHLVVREVPIVEEELHTPLVRVNVDVVDPARVECGRPPYQAMHLVAL